MTPAAQDSVFRPDPGGKVVILAVPTRVTITRQDYDILLEGIGSSAWGAVQHTAFGIAVSALLAAVGIYTSGMLLAQDQALVRKAEIGLIICVLLFLSSVVMAVGAKISVSRDPGRESFKRLKTRLEAAFQIHGDGDDQGGA